MSPIKLLIKVPHFRCLFRWIIYATDLRWHAIVEQILSSLAEYSFSRKYFANEETKKLVSITVTMGRRLREVT